MTHQDPSPAPKAHAGRLYAVLPYLFILFSGLYLAAPHLGHEIWYDESYTVLNYASRGMIRPFTDYSAPNNHVLFSAMLAAWKDWLLPERFSVLHLRLLPLLFFLGAVFLTIAASAGRGARMPGFLAGVVFAASHVTLNFALELRGYGMSWVPVAGAWWALSAYIENPQWWKAGLYALCSFAAVGILPTNLMVLGVICAWAGVILVARAEWMLRPVLWRILFICAVPFAGLVNYAGVWRELMSQSDRWNHAASVPGIMRHWYWTTLCDLWWLAPFGVAGVFLLVGQVRDCDWSPGRARSTLLLAGCAVVIPPACMLVLRYPPYPRNLVPMLPIWCGCIGLLLGPLTEYRHEWRRTARCFCLSLLAVVLVMLAVRRERDLAGFARRNSIGSRPQDLYDQYYQYRFHPAEAVNILHDLAARERIVIFTDNSDLWALIFAIKTQHMNGVGAPFMYFKDDRLTRTSLAELIHDRRLVLLTCNRNRATALLRHLRNLLPCARQFTGKSLRIADTGFFKIYAVEARAGQNQHAAHGRQAVAD